MKSLVSVVIVLTWLSNFSAVQLFQETTPLKYLTSFTGNQPTLKHQSRVTKRQTNDGGRPTPEDMAICNAQLRDASCTVGVYLGLAEAGLTCNNSNIEEAQRTANACAKGEGGMFCGSLWELNRVQANYMEGNCSQVLLRNFCPSNCRSLLENFRNTLGCCINAYVNGTGLYSGSSSLDYRVWNLCGVPLPPAACGNGPTVSPPDNVHNCTDEEIFTKYYAENLCLPKRSQAYKDVFNRLGTNLCGDSTANSTDDACSVDNNGIPCGTLYFQSSQDLAITRLESACSTSSVSCTSSCRNEITAAKNRNGCCLRSVWFNSTAALSLSVLKSCDIELPDACEGVISSAQSIMKENNILLSIGGLICLQLMML